MAFSLAKPAGSTAHALLERFGLGAGDVTEAGLAVLGQLAAEHDDLARRLAEAEDLADRDTLTPALNRRAFIRELHRTMSAVARHKLNAAVIYVDVDGLKGLNDGFGHAVGDAALRHVGRVLVESVRETDAVGRLGGDEFAVILTYANAEEARCKAASLAELIARTPVLYAGHTHRVSVSLGVHAITQPEDPETCLARADEAMYAERYARRVSAQMFAAF